MNHPRNCLSAACLFAILATPAGATSGTGNASEPAAPAGPSWQLEWDSRLRHEQVDDDAFARNAHADTLRLRLGLHAEFGHGWSGLAEGAGVASAGDRYNSGANGRVLYPAVTDPRGSEFNQYWLRWQGDRFGATAGRQRLLLDNQRWVGNSGWRQHEQTFDSISAVNTSIPGLALTYAYLYRVNRIGGPAIPLPANIAASATGLANYFKSNSHVMDAVY
ncbi:MAG: alginate export family protein, partial [Rhodanobacter sp.]